MTLVSQHFLMLDRHIHLMARITSQRATEKFQHRTERLRGLNGCTPSGRLVYNLSKKTLTQSQLALLQRDAGCNLKDAHPLDFIAALEPVMHRIGAGEETRNAIRQQITGLVMNHRDHQTLSKNEVEALDQLKKDDTILIMPADKGRATVIMDKVQYTSKALCLLNDITAYRVVDDDPMTALKNHTNKLLNNLKRSKKLDDTTLRKLRPSDTAMARFYGLPKVHKEGTPLRPIVAFRDTPTSNLAKWLSNRIGNLVEGSSTTVRSAEEFLDRIRSLRIEDDEVMVSFDVVSLFTSIPQDLAVKTIKDLLEQKGSGHQLDHLRPQDLINLLEVCLKTYFTFQGTTFEQVKGTPMGSPISSIIAEAVLQWLEHVAMAQYRPKFWARYVDDTFAIIKRSRKAGFVDILNSVCVDLQFTTEEEHQGELAFLDVLVHRQPNGTLRTRVYRKSTHTDRILHHGSNHPVSHKASCIRTLFKRVGSHCSTAKARMEERKHLVKVCRHNGYPMKFIRRHGLSCGFSPPARSQAEECTPQRLRITLPYISSVSEATARLLAPYDMRVAHKPNQTLRSKVMRMKDPLPIMEKSSVVYRVNCEGCSANYVGETSKRVRTRVHEHKLAVRRGDQYSQIGTHMLESGHRFDFNNVQVLASDNTKGGRLLKEAWLSNEKSINRHVDLCPAHVTLRTWTMRDRLSRRRQCGVAAYCQRGELMDETNPDHAWLGISHQQPNHQTNYQQLDNPPSTEAHLHPRWVQEDIDNREPITDRLKAPMEAVGGAIRKKVNTGIGLSGKHEGKYQKIACSSIGDPVTNPAHSIPLVSYACLESAAESQENREMGRYNLRASTRSHGHLKGTIPHRKAKRNASCDHKDSASLVSRRRTHLQTMDECVEYNEETNCPGEEGNYHLTDVGGFGEDTKITPFDKEGTERGSNRAIRGIGKQSEGRKGGDISKNKESACSIETTIETQTDWLGPVTRSRSRAQRALLL